MGISIADNFQYQGKKPLDSRTSYATLAAMKAVTDATISEGCLAYCEETDKYYKFKSSNTVDADTGKWRIFSGGGGESSSLEELSDVNITAPKNDDELKYDATNNKWTNRHKTTTVIEGYAQKKTVSSPMEFIMAVNQVSPYPDIIVPDVSIFDGLTANAMISVCAEEQAYLLIAENPFDYYSYSMLQSGYDRYNSKKKASSGVESNGYRSFPFYYTDGITSMSQTGFLSYLTEDVSPNNGGSILDPNKEAQVYKTSNVTTPTSGDGSDYADNTNVISKALVFYEDAEHTVIITPELGKFYYDKSTDSTYYWNGGRYVLNNTLNYNELKNKPEIPEPVQVETLPEAGSSYVGKIYQFVGATDTYVNGYFYECVNNSGTYLWEAKAVQAGGSGGTSSYNDLTDKPTLNSETISGNKTSADYGLQDQVQFDEMPTASADYLDKIVQFVGTTGTYTNGYYYKCVSDGGATPTYSWERVNVQPSGGSGGAELEETITTNLAVGAVPSGTVLAEGTSFTEVMKKLFVTELAPTTTFTASGSGIKEVGTSVTPTLTLTITDNGTGTPTSIKFYDGSTLLDTQSYASGTNTYTYTMSAVTTTKTVKGVLEYKKSDNTNGTVEKTATYTFVMASYYGAVTTAPTDKAGITALTKNVKTTKAQTATFNLSNQRSCYCYPASFGDLASIKDQNNFEYLSSYTKTNVTVDGVSYNVYTLTDPVTANGFKQIYA